MLKSPGPCLQNCFFFCSNQIFILYIHTYNFFLSVDILWWCRFTTTTRILQLFAFLCKLGILLFKPHCDYQIKIWKKKQKEFGVCSKKTLLCKLWPIKIVMLVFRCTHSEAVDTLLYSSCYFPLPVLCIPWRETESALPKHFVFQGNAFCDHFYKLLCIYFLILWFKYMKFTLFIISSSSFQGILRINLI